MNSGESCPLPFATIVGNRLWGFPVLAGPHRPVIDPHDARVADEYLRLNLEWLNSRVRRKQ